MRRPSNNPLVGVIACALFSGCTPRSLVVNALAGSLSADSGIGDTFASDDDPELVRHAIPFGLKTMEGLAAEQRDHIGLLTSLASGFTQYAYAFVQADAEKAEIEGRVTEARPIRERASRLFLRAREYGLRGLDARHGGLRRTCAA